MFSGVLAAYPVKRWIIPYRHGLPFWCGAAPWPRPDSGDAAGRGVAIWIECHACRSAG